MSGATASPIERPATAGHIRGSSVLFAGRLLSLALNLATQVLIVRLLTKTDYGAFAYALAFAPGVMTLISVGHHEILTRFLALYEEDRDYDKLFGTIVMKIATIVSGGAFAFVLVLALQGLLSGSGAGQSQSTALLLILIWLAPLDGIGYVFEAVFAVFSRPRAIFFRKYLLVPGMRFSFAIVLMALGGSVTVLAIGYVSASLFGLVAYGAMAVRFFRERGLLVHFNRRTIVMPFREVFGFSLPLLSTDLVYISMTTVSVILLGHFSGAADVANYRAIFPVARLNSLVFATFALLFTPLATRLFARGDRAGMRDAYWHTAVWLAVLTFPIFAVAGPLAQPTTVLLFGDRYGDAAILLALLASGFYFNAALGYNALTLTTHGHNRFVAKVNLAAAVLNIGLSVVLISRHGALGVAIANASTLVLQNVFNQVGMSRRIGIRLAEWRYVRPYLVITSAAVGLAVVQMALHPPAVVSFALAGLATIFVFAANREILAIEATFPELLRVPGLRRLATSPGAA